MIRLGGDAAHLGGGKPRASGDDPIGDLEELLISR